MAYQTGDIASDLNYWHCESHLTASDEMRKAYDDGVAIALRQHRVGHC